MTKYIDQIITYYDSNGEPLSRGKLNFYEAGTTTRTPVYSDEDLTTALSNPVVADADGRFEPMYMQQIKYKIVLTDCNNVVIETIDDVDYTGEREFNDIKQYATTTVSGVVILATAADVIEGTDTEKAVTPAAIKTALEDLTVSPVGFIHGLIPNSSSDVDHDLTLSIGFCRNADNDADINLESAITKQTDADWDAGTGAGGMPATVVKTGTFTSVGTAVTGITSDFSTEFSAGDILWSNSLGEGRVIESIGGATSITLESAFTSDISVAEDVYKNGLAADATYHMFAISNAAGTNADAGFDTQLNASNLLADSSVVAGEFTKYRIVWSFITDSSGNIIPFKNNELSGGGLRTSYNSQILDLTGAISAGLQAISTPKMVEVLANINLTVDGGNYINIADGSSSDLGSIDTTTANSFDRTADDFDGIFNGSLMTNTSAQLRVSGSDGASYLNTKGYQYERF